MDEILHVLLEDIGSLLSNGASCIKNNEVVFPKICVLVNSLEFIKTSKILEIGNEKFLVQIQEDISDLVQNTDVSNETSKPVIEDGDQQSDSSTQEEVGESPERTPSAHAEDFYSQLASSKPQDSVGKGDRIDSNENRENKEKFAENRSGGLSNSFHLVDESTQGNMMWEPRDCELSSDSDKSKDSRTKRDKMFFLNNSQLSSTPQ